MNTVMGEALQKALASKKNDYSNFIWKGEKVKEGDKFVQVSKRLIDMSEEELNKCYDHCEKMLYNTDPRNLGRYNVLVEVKDQINKCNVELFLRYCENSYKHSENRKRIERRHFWLSLRQFMEDSNKDLIENGKEEIKDWSTISIAKATSNLPGEFEDISIESVLEGCIDCLGAFDKQHLTMTFITKVGLWFTKAEENELGGVSNVDRVRIAKEKLHLPTKLVLKCNAKGLSYYEMRSILTLPKKQKYSDMTTDQLITLRDKVLLRLSKEIDKHIYNWRKLQSQIKLVAKDKGFKINALGK